MIARVVLVVAIAGCADPAENPRTYDEFLVELPDAICDYYVRCGVIESGERAMCPSQLRDDLERDLGCNAARGLYPSLADDLGGCIDDDARACAATDDLTLFCPNLGLLEDQCAP